MPSYLEGHGLVGHLGHARVEERLGVGEPEDSVGDIHVPGGGGRGQGEGNLMHKREAELRGGNSGSQGVSMPGEAVLPPCIPEPVRLVKPSPHGVPAPPHPPSPHGAQVPKVPDVVLD